MPEIAIVAPRYIGNVPSETQHELLHIMREQGQIQMWNMGGTEEECERSWREFLLRDMPDGVIYS